MGLSSVHLCFLESIMKKPLLLPLFLLILSPISGCQLLDAANNSSCTEHSSSYQEAVAVEGQLTTALNEEEEYPMAMVFSQDAVNRLFAAVSDADLPDITLSETPLGVPVTVTIDPQLPLLQLGGDLGCTTCLLTEAGFGLTIDVAGAAVSGNGVGRYQFPLSMEIDGYNTSSMMAGLGQSEVLSLDLQISGVSDSIMNIVEPLVADAVTYYIQNDYGDTKLFDVEPWEFGNGDVKLVGRGPHLSPENRTIVIGMRSNLVRAQGGTIDWQPTLPEGADVGLQFHPELIQSMISRMMNEGHIARSYDSSGSASEAGEQQVTLNQMSAADNGLLNTSFTLWRTAGGFCGFADLQAGLGLSISDQKLSFAVDNLQITDSAGAGDLLKYTNEWMGGDYLSDLVNFSELTVNYNELSIPGDKKAEMSAESFRLDLDASGLNLYLNVDAIVDAAID